MRIIASIIFGFALSAQAQASSFVVLGTTNVEKAASIIYAGETNSVEKVVAAKATPSIVAFGQPAASETQLAKNEPPKSMAANYTPSMISLAAPLTVEFGLPIKGITLPPIRPITTSLVAMGQPAPPVSSEVVASIRNPPSKVKLAARIPTLIRGGIFSNEIGNTAAEATPTEAPKTEKRPTDAPAPEPVQPSTPTETPM